MADLVVVVGMIAFFAIAALFVAACDWIIGPDPAPAAVASDVDEIDVVEVTS